MLVNMISSVPTAGVEPATSNRVTAGALPLRYVGVCQGIAAPGLSQVIKTPLCEFGAASFHLLHAPRPQNLE